MARITQGSQLWFNDPNNGTHFVTPRVFSAQLEYR